MYDSQEAAVLAVGDPRRPLIRRAIIATLLAAAFYSVTAGPVKQIKVVYDHAPWANDPYDTFVSFAMFFAPLLTAGCLARVLLCRRAEPLSVQRVIDLLRGCRVVLGLIVITALAQWVAVAAGADRALWNGATWLQIGFLAVTTVLTVAAIVRLRQVPLRPRRRAPASGPAADDWLADSVVMLGRLSRRLGPLASPARAGLTWIDRCVVALVRRHPLWAAVAAAVAFGIVTGGVQAIGEGYPAGPALLTVSLLSCGMFAFLVGAGGYLGFVRGPAILTGVARRLLDASVITCVCLLAALAFRNSLWWIVGGSASTVGLADLAWLLGGTALAVFALVVVIETMLRSHRGSAGQLPGDRRVNPFLR
jgi:hypothetical protein